MIRHILENNAYFHDYVVYYTNAAMLIRKDYQGTEDLNGLFSGYDPETGTYADQSSWEYQYDEQGRPLTDPTLQHPQCVFQIMRRHFARYTPEMVEHVCGVSQEQFQLVVQTIIENSGRERTTALCYAVGWTQQSKGVQIIRAGAIIQLLLGNVGRPGGGIQALRGHACIQGATDIPTLYDLLSGYMPQPGALLSAQPRAEDVATHMTWGVKTDEPSNAQSQQTLQEYIDSTGEKLGWWSNIPAYMKSLLKAWYGEAVNDPESDSGYRWIPKITGDHSHLVTSYAMLDGKIKGYFLFGQNPAAGSTNSRMQRKALGQLDWMVILDLYEVESAAFWYKEATPHVDKIDPSKIKTEVFLMPAAASTEKAGSFTNTQRVIQWRDKAVDPPGDARSDLWFVYHLGKRLKELYADSKERKKYLWWDEEQRKWTGYDVPDFPVNRSPNYTPPAGAIGMDAHSGSDPFMMKPDGKAWLFAPKGLKDGPLPAHYEAAESPVRNALYAQQSNPAAKYFRDRPDNLLTAVGDETYPIVITTYRLTEHHVSGPMTRWMPWLNALQPALFAEISPELAAEKKIQHGDWVIISTPRGEIDARAMVTRRMRPLRLKGRVVHQIGLPFHWGFQGKSTGSITNDLAHMVLEPNVSIEEAKAFMCNVRPGQLS